MRQLLGLIAVYVTPESQHFRGKDLLEPMCLSLENLERLQGPDGLFDGVNLCSPPDSAFTINDACLALQVIRRASRAPVKANESAVRHLTKGDQKELFDIGRRLGVLIAASTTGLLSGGVHTPNHRWELCAALAQIHRLEPHPEINRRINEWLSEGIDQLRDGMYSERSPLYAAAVTNPSLVTIADNSSRPWLLDHVRKNLEAFLSLFNPDGTVEAVFSRRQDQWLDFDGSMFMPMYRRLAIEDQRPDFAAAASWLSGFEVSEPTRLLADSIVTPQLRQSLPPVPTNPWSLLRPSFTQLETCGLYRFRHGQTSTTVFGGGDHSSLGATSGLSNNPTFLKFRHGSSVLSDVRLSRNFFDLGPFRSMTTSLDRGAAKVEMSEVIEAAYYHPLPPERRRDDGIYALEHEGRFSSAMGFSHRPTTKHNLKTHVGIQIEGDQAVIQISFEGTETPFSLELTFQSGGVLNGVEPLGDSGAYQLVAGTGTYSVDGDTIQFGPGADVDVDSHPIYNPGENYKYLRGSNATSGTKVYITGRTRGIWRLTLRGIS